MYVTLIGLPRSSCEMGVEIGKDVCLKKEPTNSVDTEAIQVIYNGETVGYVANSVKSVARGTFSAGRLYDKFDECIEAEVKFILPGGAVIAEIKEW